MYEDPYQGSVANPMSPAETCFAITPHDSDDLPRATKAIYVGQGGNLCVRPVRNDADVTFVNVPDGAILDLRLRAVRLTGTTASGLVGLS